MPRPHRWPIVVAVIVLGVPLFVLSEAPLRKVVGRPGTPFWKLWAPLDPVIRWPPLLTQLTHWAHFWDVDEPYIWDRAERLQAQVLWHWDGTCYDMVEFRNVPIRRP